MTRLAISSGPKSTRGARIFLGLVFGVFLAFGLWMGGMMFGRPALRIIDAVDWSAVPCDILSSTVATHDGTEGSTYSVAVTYRYAIDGRSYVGDRYKFVRMSSSGRARKARVVAALPPGKQTTCYVNPADPADAVIERGPTADLLWGIIPLVFAVVGFGGVAGAILGRGRLASGVVPGRAPPTHVIYEDAPERGRLTQLLPMQSRGLKLTGTIVFAVFWNGILSIFLTEIISNWRNHIFDWVAGTFVTPFVLVGVVLVVLVVHMGLSYFSPRPVLTVNSPVVPLGGEVRLRWAVDGRVEKLRRFSITLEGREEATFRRGTDTKTDKSVFARWTLVDQPSPVAMHGGSTRVVIPADTMHSFEAPHNKIVWVLRVVGDVVNWPDSEDEFRLTVAPRAR